MATRGIGAGNHAAALNQIQNLQSGAKISLDAGQVKELSAGLAKNAEDLIGQFLKLKGSGDMAGANKLMGEQTVGATIDKFVMDAEAGTIALPAGTSGTDVVGEAVSRFLEAGFTYNIDFNSPVGSRSMTARLDDSGDVSWNDMRAR